MEDNCLFCKIIKGEIPAHKVYEDAYSLAFLDIRPVNSGHTLVIPKLHSENIYTLAKDTLHQLADTAQKVSIALKEIGAEGVNIIMNNDASADQVIFHAHLHLIPRFKGDGREPWHGTVATKEKLEAKASDLKAKLV